MTMLEADREAEKEVPPGASAVGVGSSLGGAPWSGRSETTLPEAVPVPVRPRTPPLVLMDSRFLRLVELGRPTPSGSCTA
jgi:hypothetical protein